MQELSLKSGGGRNFGKIHGTQRNSTTRDKPDMPINRFIIELHGLFLNLRSKQVYGVNTCRLASCFLDHMDRDDADTDSTTVSSSECRTPAELMSSQLNSIDLESEFYHVGKYC